MQEIWRDIPGFENAYQASNLGRVRSLPGGHRQAKVLRPNLTRKGYFKFIPRVNGKSYTVEVHVAVATAFYGPRPPGMEVAHNNGDSMDNRIENLRFDSPSENIRDVVRHGNHHLGNRTHCSHGHEFTPENTLIQRSGMTVDGRVQYRRRCRECLHKKHLHDSARRRERRAAA